MKYTKTDFENMRKCVKRELELRKRVYPKWVLAKRMSQQKADYEIQEMEKICNYFDYMYIFSEPEQKKLF